MNRPNLLLFAGMLGGILAATFSIVSGVAAPGLPGDAVARVGERVITREEWRRAVAAVEAERRTPLAVAERRQVLDRLVDEELLVQHGVALGLLERDRRLRGQLVADVMATAVPAAVSDDDAALARYYETHRAYFASPGRAHVAAIRVAGPPQRSADEARARAGQAVQRLRDGERLATVRDALGDPMSPSLPDALLPASALQTYLGPTLTGLAWALEPGATADPMAHGTDYLVLHVIEREPAWAPPLEQVADAVRERMRRTADERAVRALLAELRAQAGVQVREPLE